MLKGGNPCGVFLTNVTEVQIAIDISHEPWKTLAAKVVGVLSEELQEMDFQIQGLNDLLDIIAQQEGELQ